MRDNTMSGGIGPTEIFPLVPNPVLKPSKQAVAALAKHLSGNEFSDYVARSDQWQDFIHEKIDLGL